MESGIGASSWSILTRLQLFGSTPLDSSTEAGEFLKDFYWSPMIGPLRLLQVQLYAWIAARCDLFSFNVKL